MSDGVFIPGISNKYNSQSAIEKIMSKKKEKLTELDNDKAKIEDKQKNLLDINSKVVTLDKSAKKLYGVNNPFEEKIAISSDENISAKVTRNADIGEYFIKVEQKAQAHRIASRSLDRKTKIEAGNYIINIGEDKVNIRFQGGTIDDFQKAINEQGKTKIKASQTYDTSKTSIFVLESLNSGEKNRIFFEDPKTNQLFKDLGFFENVPSFSEEYIINSNNTKSNTQNKQLNIKDSRLIVETDNSYNFKFNNPVSVNDGIILEIDFSVINKNKKIDSNINQNKQEEILTGPNLSKVGETTIFDIFIPGDTMILPQLEEKKVEKDNKKEEKPKIVNDKRFLEIVTNNGVVKLEELNVTTEPKFMKFKLSDILQKDEQVIGLNFLNNDTEQILTVGKIKIYDKDSLGGIKYTNELSKPQDAIFYLDGLKLTRSSNTIDDLLKGVTFNIFGPTQKEARVQVDRDYQTIVKVITDFIGDYNQLLDAINTKTKYVAKDSPLTEEEKKAGTGVLSDEMELKNLASKLRIIMMNSYPTRYGEEMALLSQIGISTNETEGGMRSADKLKGLLEINESKFTDKFTSAMEKYPEGVMELFGNDTDKDFVFDSGIAVEINKLLKAYLTKSTGYFDMRKQAYQNQIKNKNEEIDKYKKKLEEEEKKLKEQFLKMEKAAQELEDNRKKFDNLNKQ